MFISKKVPERLNNLRIDLILKELKFVDSRNKALSVIMSGNVFIDESKVDKPGKLVKYNSIVKLKKKDHDWVSRGGIKLDHALRKVKLNVRNKICLDIGCSTGGFTEVLLNNGVRRVYAVDVGYGQFDWKLRNSKKVVLLERTNARSLNENIISEKVDLIVCDVSFISLKKVILPSKRFLNDKFDLLALLKPQFETEKKNIGNGGIIKNPEIHKQVCFDIESWIKKNFKFQILKIFESPILGQKGNKEFFIYLKN